MNLTSRPALFLDRDGVVNVDRPYVHTIDQFDFEDGIFELVRRAILAGFVTVVVTNQAGIGRGFFSEAHFLDLTEWMRAEFVARGAAINAVYHCPFHPEHGIGPFKVDSFDRKPNPGMILRAKDDLGLDLSRSILVGNKPSDIAAAKAGGVGLAILLSKAEILCEPAPDVRLASLFEVIARLFPEVPPGS